MADRYQKQIYFPKEEEEILKEINIRSKQVIEKSECSICRGRGEGKKFLMAFFFFLKKTTVVVLAFFKFEKCKIKAREIQKDAK